jgi:hypothetical protein
MQLDEMTNITNVSDFTCIRYEWEGEVLEDILYCNPLKRTITSDQLFHILVSNIAVECALILHKE